MGEQKLNIKLFKKIREKIATTPEAYDQGAWGRREETAPCGTAACVAGWACALSGVATTEELAVARTGIVRAGWIADIAATRLGLEDDEAAVLFNPRPADEDLSDEYAPWPEPFASQWRSARKDVLKESRAAVAYLDHIIETGKVLE